MASSFHPALAEADLPETDEGAPPLSRLQHVSLQDRVYQELRDAIRSGRFVSGEAITIRSIADLLGVSTMPVRAAINRLVQERTLELLPNRTMRVPHLSIERFDEITDIRATLEGRAAERAAERIDAAALADVRAWNERMREGIDRDDMPAVLAANQRFHFAIYQAAQSDVMLAMIDTLWQQGGPYIASMTRSSMKLIDRRMASIDMIIGRHFEVVEALASRNAAAAGEAMKRDLIGSAASYRSVILFDQTAHTEPFPSQEMSKP